MSQFFTSKLLIAQSIANLQDQNGNGDWWRVFELF